MQSDPTRALERLAERVAGAAPLAIVPMPGGASTRLFFRVELAGGERGVGMFVPDANRSDEIAKDEVHQTRWPFLEVRDLLAERGVRVPRLHGEATHDGVILVEDLGDDTLAVFLDNHPEQRESLYRQAVTDLAKAQQGLEPLPADSVVNTRAFDEDLLRWEVDHFREWGLEARGIVLDSRDRAAFDAAADHLARTIASWPRGFVHRDYQSRNLMVQDGELVWIDFQDALLGPRVYDLVALLNDSYQTFTREFVERRLDDFAEARGLDAEDRVRLGREFDVVTVQRKLKDAGRFVFIDRERGNPDYLEFVEPTIGKARRSLERLVDEPVLNRLSELLGRVLPG